MTKKTREGEYGTTDGRKDRIFKKETIKDLCKNLTSVASRTTIQSILIDGVNKDYLSKEVDQKDKRKKYYNCNNLREVITKWFQRNKLIFTS